MKGSHELLRELCRLRRPVKRQLSEHGGDMYRHCRLGDIQISADLLGQVHVSQRDQDRELLRC